MKQVGIGGLLGAIVFLIVHPLIALLLLACVRSYGYRLAWGRGPGLPERLLTGVIAWHTVHVMPAWAVG